MTEATRTNREYTERRMLTLSIELQFDLVSGNRLRLVGLGLTLSVRVAIGARHMLAPVVMAEMEAVRNSDWLLFDLHDGAFLDC